MLDQAIRVIRNPPPRTEGGITIPKKTTCFCGKKVPPQDMLRIRDTGVVKGVLSMVCRDCPNGACKTVAKLYAIVCARCREVVRYDEPFVEPRSGFKWRAGRVYHVPECPVCVGRIFEHSPVIEQNLFYKEHGIPYRDEGVQAPSEP